MLSCLSMYLFSECVYILKPQQFLFSSLRILFSECVHILQAPTVFILFIVVSVFRVAHRATALHSDKAVESSLS